MKIASDNWFGFLWIGVLIIAYLIWTIKCIRDFINDCKSCWKLSFLFVSGASWAHWIVIHVAVLFIWSLIAFLFYGGWL